MYLSEIGRLDEALPLLEAAAARPDAGVDALNALGIGYARRGGQTPLAVFGRILDIDARNVMALQNIGSARLAAGDLDGAARVPAGARRQSGLGRSSHGPGRRREPAWDRAAAIEAWTRAVRLNPSDFDALFNLATELINAGQTAAARPLVERFVHRRPEGLTAGTSPASGPGSRGRRPRGRIDAYRVDAHLRTSPPETLHAYCTMALVGRGDHRGQPPLLRSAPPPDPRRRTRRRRSSGRASRWSASTFVSPTPRTPIRDLKADEIEIFEGGDRRPVLLFQHVIQPIGTYAEVAQRTIASEVSTNQGAPRGNVYVLVFDQAHITAGNEQRARQAAERFLRRRLKPGDRVALYALPGPGPQIEFTADAGRAIRELSSVRGSREDQQLGATGPMRVYEAYEIARGNQEVLGRYVLRLQENPTASDATVFDQPPDVEARGRQLR